LLAATPCSLINSSDGRGICGPFVARGPFSMLLLLAAADCFLDIFRSRFHIPRHLLANRVGISIWLGRRFHIPPICCRAVFISRGDLQRPFRAVLTSRDDLHESALARFPWPGRAPKRRFHTRNLSRNQGHGKGPLATKGPKMSLPTRGAWQGCKNMEERPGLRRARKCRFHTRNLSRNQGGVARHQKDGKAPLCQEGPQNVDSIHEIYQGTRGVARPRKHGKGPLATKGRKTSLPHRKFIKKPGGRGKAAKTWKSAPGHEWQGRKNMEKRPWPRRAPKCRFHTRNLSRNQGGMARHQKHGKRGPGHEGPQNVASTQGI
jgi:hypothetical protein